MGAHPLYRATPAEVEETARAAAAQAAHALRIAAEAEETRARIDGLESPNTNAVPNTTAADESPNTSDGNPSVPDFSTRHGELERPTRAGSTEAWRAYAAADPQGAPQGYETMTRDQLATLYLDAPADPAAPAN